jgi:hypothetical protein
MSTERSSLNGHGNPQARESLLWIKCPERPAAGGAAGTPYWAAITADTGVARWYIEHWRCEPRSV